MEAEAALVKKLDPRLRMVANGDEVVNTIRAEQDPALAVTQDRLLQSVPRMQVAGAHPVSRGALPDHVRRGQLAAVPDSVHVSVFVHLKEGVDRVPAVIPARAHAVKTVRKHNLIATVLPLSGLQALLQDPDVVLVERAEALRFDPPVATALAAGPTRLRAAAFPDPEAVPGGAGVLIGIVDVQGFDFAHPDFLEEDGTTRFVRIWDQGGDSRPAPGRFGYGTEIHQDHMNAALAGAEDIGLPATVLEPQSQMAPGSHGTHVSSIAAGNHGLCPQALLAGVLLTLPEEDLDRRRSFYDSTRLAHAIDYLFAFGEALGVPVSVNVSLGTNGHAHDASSVTSRWIDSALASTGRSVCVAAGNAGQEAPTEAGDWGFVTGRIHTSGRIEESDGAADLEWIVIGDGIADLSENELEIWYVPQDRFAVQIKPPGLDWIGPLEPGDFIENQELFDGSFLSAYNDLYSPANGHNHIACYLSPFFSREGLVGVRAGTWLVRLIGRDVRHGGYHAWVERDDPRRLGRIGVAEAWRFPSFFSVKTNVDEASVSSLACGHRVISVANLDESAGAIHVTSSQGPTRDRREKPEIAAPGTDIVAARGFDPGQLWMGMTGTSMASPYVAGVVGLMLAESPQLTAAQIGGIIRRTAHPFPDSGFQWRNDAGYGRIDPEACLEEVARFQRREDLTS